jgi:hypothetical protein
MNAEKQKPKQKQLPPKTQSVETKPPQIPLETLKEFVGDVKNLKMITARHIYDNRFRVNVWIEEFKDENMFRSPNIAKSYFVHYHEGTILDETIQPEPQKEKIF